MNNITVYYQNRKNHLACTMFHPKYTNDFSKTHTKVYEGMLGKDENLEDVFFFQIMINKNEYFEKKKNLVKFNENKTWENINQKIIKYFNEN